MKVMDTQGLSPNKRQESRYMDEVRRASSIFPGGKLVPHEKPDLLLHTDNGVIGIEHRMEGREVMKNSRRMFVGVLPTTFLLLVVAGTALAQDVVKVSPETHKVVLENDQVRVLGVHVKPGEMVAMHSHPASVVYYLSDAKIKFTYPGGRTEERECKAGAAVWSAAGTHAAENVGRTELQEVQTELKGAAKKPARSKKKTI